MCRICRLYYCGDCMDDETCIECRVELPEDDECNAPYTGHMDGVQDGGGER